MTPDSATERAELTPRETFFAVLNNTVRNVVVIGVGVLFLVWFSGIWLLGAKIGFWLAVVLAVIEGIHAGVAAILTVTLNAAGKPRTGERWMIAANGVQLAGAASVVAFVLILRSKIWG
jgi:uncharacterized membrane protein